MLTLNQIVRLNKHKKMEDRIKKLGKAINDLSDVIGQVHDVYAGTDNDKIEFSLSVSLQRMRDEYEELLKSEIIHIPAGSSLYQGHITLRYPAYDGPRNGWYDYYESQLKDWHPSQRNDVYWAMSNYII
jgi:hypothetical protein